MRDEMHESGAGTSDDGRQAAAPDSSLIPHPSSLAFGRVARLTRKELSEILRDRRTILTLVAMPLLLYPLLSVAFQQFFLASRANPARGPEYRLGFPTAAEGKLFVARLARGEAELERRRRPDTSAEKAD